MLDAALLREVDGELRKMLEGDAARPDFPDPVRPWPHATPDGECLSLLSALLRHSERCTTHPAAFGYCWNQAMRVVAGLATQGHSLAGVKVLEVGSGVENPLGVSMILMMLGAERALTIDRLAPTDPAAAAEATLRFFVHLSGLFPTMAWRLPALIRSEVLARGRLFEALTSPWFGHQTCEVEDLTASYLFDAVHSNAVIQHLTDPEAAVAAMSRLTAPGGVHVHLIDFVDPDCHTRKDSTDPDGPFRFLTVEDSPAGCGVNRLRLSQVVALFERHGLVLDRILESWRRPMPPEVRARLASPFRDLSDDDLETTGATLLFRKMDGVAFGSRPAPEEAAPEEVAAEEAAPEEAAAEEVAAEPAERAVPQATEERASEPTLAQLDRRRVLGETLSASAWLRLGGLLGQCKPLRRRLADPAAPSRDIENHVRRSRWIGLGRRLGLLSAGLRAVFTDALRYQTDLTESQQGSIRQALLETIFRDRDSAWIESQSGRNDVANHVLHRYAEGCNFYVPWVEKVMSLANRTVVEIGCGTGSSTAAFARKARHVYGYDLDGPSVEATRRRMAVQGLNNVTLAVAQPDEILEALARRHFGEVDVMLLSAVLEHCTLRERLAYIEASWHALRPGGLLVVTETPNRLHFFDYHTSFLPFFNSLPDDLALLYAARSPRQDFRDLLTGEAPDEEKRMRLTRFGRGMSYHEFELALPGDLRALVAADGWDPLILALRPLVPGEDSLRETVVREGYPIPPGFLRRDIDVILRKPRDA